MMNKAIIFFLLLALPVVVQAQPAENVPAGALEITAQNGLEWNQNNKTYRAIGNAIARRDDLTVQADELTAYAAPAGSANNLEKIIATGNVVIIRAGTEIVGDAGVYNLASGEAEVTGDNLKLTMPEQTVTARDRLTYNERTQTATAIGNAVAIKGDRRLGADQLVAQFEQAAATANDKNLQLRTLTARGNVLITTAQDSVRGNDAVYDVMNDNAIITGNVSITRGPNQLAGDKATVDMKTGISKLLPSAAGGRVRGLIFPNVKK